MRDIVLEGGNYIVMLLIAMLTTQSWVKSPQTDILQGKRMEPCNDVPYQPSPMWVTG